MTMQRHLVGAACAMALLTAPATAMAQGAEYEVTVTNATRGQTFTPLAVITHAPGVRLFQVGRPAPSVLEALAEEGDVAPLIMLAQSAPTVVFDAQTSGAPPAGVTGPGQSTTVVPSGSVTVTTWVDALVSVPLASVTENWNGRTERTS